jgi:hypothetical protein
MIELGRLDMGPAMDSFVANPEAGALAALEHCINHMGNQGRLVNGVPLAQGGVPRNLGFGPFPGASPAMLNQGLPGSPHMVGSPGLGHIQAPGMQLQPSQQGTSSSGPSANTSPSQTGGKKRRASNIKNEDDGPTSLSLIGAPQVNGMPNKAKPSPSMAKRLKGNPA